MKTDPDANRADFFNYGFSEETWRVYASEVQAAWQRTPSVQLNTHNTAMKRNRTLNFFLPHNYGGFGDPLPDLKHLNLFTEEIDVPQIKPRTVNQNHEFYVKVAKEESSLALTREETETICFPPTF